MNEYKFTFEDGSEALAHYGVKGMKWGEWNEETQQRYANDGQEHIRRFNDFVNTQNEHAANQSTMVESGLYKEGTKSVPEATLANIATVVAHNVDNFIKEAGRVLSEVSENVVNTGKDIIDSLFGTEFGPTKQNERRKKNFGYESHARNQATVQEQMNRDAYENSKAGLEATTNAYRNIKNTYNQHAANQGSMYEQPTATSKRRRKF